MHRKISALALLASAALLQGGVSAHAGSSVYPNRTIIYYERSHGVQVEYYSPAGGAHLWYPGNRRVVSGRWQTRDTKIGQQICFQYGANTYNPVTRKRGGRWECSLASRHRQIMKYSCKGDVFNLSNRAGKIPYILPRYPFALEKLKSACGRPA